MAIILMDGFDHYNSLTAASGGIYSRWGGNAQSLTSGIWGGQAVRFTGSQALSHALPAGSTFSMQMAIKVEVGASGTTPIQVVLSTTGAYQCGFMVLGDRIYAHRGGTSRVDLAVATKPVVLGNWHQIEVEIVLSQTAGRMTIWQDGDQVINVTNVDTVAHASDITANQLLIGATYNTGSSGGTISYDHLVVTDSATRPSALYRIETSGPSSDGGTLQWAPSSGLTHFPMVDELPVSITDHLQASNVGDLDILGFPALSVTPSSIAAVQLSAYAMKTDAALRSAYLGVGSGGTNNQGPAFNLGASLMHHQRILETDPNTSAAWTKAAVDAMTARLEVAV